MYSNILDHSITFNTILRPTYTPRRYPASSPLSTDISVDQSPSHGRVCACSDRLVVSCCLYTVSFILLSTSYILRYTCINKSLYIIFYHYNPFES
jgi:hypothetical protein